MKEHNYLSISLFILVIFLLLIGGNFLIKNKYNSLKDKSHQEIRIDTSKEMTAKNFNIKEEAKKLEEYYLNLYNNGGE